MVRFAVDEPKRFRVLDNDFAVGGGVANAFREECAIDGHIFACKEPDSDLGFVAVEGAALEASAFVRKTHNGPGFRVGAADVTSIDPKVARAQPVYAPRADNDGTFCHRYSFPKRACANAPGCEVSTNQIASSIRYNVDKDTAEIYVPKTSR